MIILSDVETLVMQLERSSGGAHIHTAGKARMYLRMIADKPDSKFSNCTSDEFVQAVKNAAYKNEWKPLSDLMARWW